MANLIYCRVSTLDQHTENQVQEIQAAGYEVDPEFVYADEVSGSVSYAERPGFSRLLLQCRRGDVLVVTKLDRLGRNQIDVQSCIKTMQSRGVGVVVLQLGRTDLTSSAGRLIVAVLAAVAEMERDLIRERTLAGLARVRAQGGRLGRPRLEDTHPEVTKLLREGKSIRVIARILGCSPATVQVVKKRCKGIIYNR